jgi:hypothetical protein
LQYVGVYITSYVITLHRRQEKAEPRKGGNGIKREQRSIKAMEKNGGNGTGAHSPHGTHCRTEEKEKL